MMVIGCLLLAGVMGASDWAIPQDNPPDFELIQKEMDFQQANVTRLGNENLLEDELTRSIEDRIQHLQEKSNLSELQAKKLRILGRGLVVRYKAKVRGLNLKKDIDAWHIDKEGRLLPGSLNENQRSVSFGDDFVELSGTPDEIIAKDDDWTRSVEKVLRDGQLAAYKEHQRERRKARLEKVLRALMGAHGDSLELTDTQRDTLVLHIVNELPETIGDLSEYECKARLVAELSDSQALKDAYLELVESADVTKWRDAWESAERRCPRYAVRQLFGGRAGR